MAVKSKGKQVAKTTTSTKGNTTSMVAQQMGVIVKAGGGDMASKKEKAGASKTCKGDPVAVTTGAVVERVTDIQLRGRVLVDFARRYNSADAASVGPFGRGGWNHSYHQWVELEADHVVLRNDDGRDVEFTSIEPTATSFDRKTRYELHRDRNGTDWRIVCLNERLIRNYAPLSRGGPAMLQSIVDAWGNSVSLDYEDGVLVSITDTAGRQLRLLSENKRIKRLEVWADEALCEHFDYAYSDTDELASAANALGHTHRYEYDGLHRLVKKTLKNGVSFYYRYDSDHGLCVKTWGDGGVHAVELEYDLEAGTTTTHGEPQPRVFTWDESGALLKEETFDNNYVREFSYDDDLLVLSETNAAGLTKSCEYDERGRKTAETDRAGNVTQYEYEDGEGFLGSLKAVVRPGGIVTRYTHNRQGALTSVCYPDGSAYSLDYDGRGRVVRLSGPDGTLVERGFDEKHNLMWERNARDATATYEYDALGLAVTRSETTTGTSRVRYDAVGQPVEITRADGTKIKVRYNANGEPVWAMNPLGKTVSWEYVGTGVLSKFTNVDGQVWRVHYDREQKPIAIENPKGERFEYRYDAAGRVIEERTFDGRTLSYSYSLADQLARIEYPDGTWRAFQHDALGDVIVENSSHGTISYERDAVGRILEAVLDEDAEVFTVGFERDALGRVVSETQNGHSVRYEYDNRGRRAARFLPNGETTRYRYDDYGTLMAVSHDGHEVVWDRDGVGRQTRMTISSCDASLHCEYDSLNRLLLQKMAAPQRDGQAAQEILIQRRYQYDQIGRLAATEDERWGGTQYRYGPEGNLLEALRHDQHEIFRYDPGGALTGALRSVEQPQETWAVARGNVLLRSDTHEYRYDENKRRTASAALVDGEPVGGTDEYIWDCRDRLRQVTLADGRTIRFFYDPFGRRVRKEVREAVVAPGDEAATAHIVTYLWDDYVLVQEDDHQWGRRVFVHHPYGDTPLLQQEQGKVFTYVTDHLGTPRELVDPDGRIAWSARHSAWGEVVEVQREVEAERPVASPFRLLGQYHDEETGLCCTAFRYFDPRVARFLSSDPLGAWATGDLFAFPGSPTQVTDPLGLLGEWESADYGSPDHKYDGLDAHELLQSCWLRHHGYGGRSSRLGRQNPAIALDPSFHRTPGPIGSRQREAGLHDPDVIRTMTGQEVIDINAQILEEEMAAELARAHEISDAEAAELAKLRVAEFKEDAEKFLEEIEKEKQDLEKAKKAKG